MTRLVADLKSTTVEAQIAVFDWEGSGELQKEDGGEPAVPVGIVDKDQTDASDCLTLKSLLLSGARQSEVLAELEPETRPMRNGHAKWLVTAKRFGMKVALVGA